MREMESGMIIGYARVSTDGQTLDAQHSALAAAGATRVFVTERKALARAIAACGPGDTLIVTKLDRLARSTRRYRQGWCGVPLARGHLGRYHHSARTIDADRPWRPCGV
jgi:hypothetical protein